jgi:phosphatidylinositol-bisphosphatase
MQAKKAFDGFTENPITHLPFVSSCLHDSITNIDRYRTYRFSAGLTTDLLGYDFKWASLLYLSHTV